MSYSKHTLLLPFSAVTEKPSGNPKDTLLISREINNPSANGFEQVLLFRLSMHVSRYRCCQKKGNRGMRKQESSYIRMNACKPTCVWVLVNANACGHTHAGLQACPHSDLPAFLLACRPVCLRACLPAHRQARRQAIRKQAGSNTMWKRY